MESQSRECLCLFWAARWENQNLIPRLFLLPFVNGNEKKKKKGDEKNIVFFFSAREGKAYS